MSDFKDTVDIRCPFCNELTQFNLHNTSITEIHQMINGKKFYYQCVCDHVWELGLELTQQLFSGVDYANDVEENAE